MEQMEVLDVPSTQSQDEVLKHYGVEKNQGLSEDDVKQRREQFGENRLRETARRSTLSILIDQFKSIIVALLVVASVLAFAFGDIIEGFAIVVVILINAAIGFFTELRAVRSMEALKELGQVKTRVRRDGNVREIDATEIVPGDILILEGGDVVTADARLLEAAKLQVNESALTGESVPVSKTVESLDEQLELAERTDMIFKGTAVTRGSGEAVVVATGMDTELGHISSLVEEAEDETTPLEQRLDQLGQRLVWLTLIVASFVVVAGVVSGKELRLMIETAIALAVASIPEGLPIVATIALARGMQRMAKRNALINRLSTVETLGATNIICTDKTGTLTENQMTVQSFYLADQRIELEEQEDLSPLLKKALQIGVLCNNASLNAKESDDDQSDDDQDEAVGEPLEVALLRAGAKYDLKHRSLTDEMPEAREVAFDTETNMMATFHEQNGAYYVAVKGAPEAVLDVCTQIYMNLDNEETQDLSDVYREDWLERNTDLAGDGLRMLAIAEKSASSKDDEPYENLTFVGLIGLLDPPREDVADAIEKCRNAGIRVVMVTGDQPATAENIGFAVGLIDRDSDDQSVDIVRGKELKSTDSLSDDERQRLLDTIIFARVNPAQKLDIIQLHQDAGMRVAMTGDGVNDAPALKKADIGIAMGMRGTQVAKETADMVLTDDALSTIVIAVEQGRVIFENIRKFVLYLLSCNLSEILIVGLASLVSAPLPINPLQILFLNLVTDVFPALALGVGEGDESVMDHDPRNPDESIITRNHWLRIGLYSALITVSVLSVFAIALISLEMTTERAVTIAFLTLAFAQLWHVFNMRDVSSPIFINEVTRNPWIWGAIVLCVALLLIAAYVPFMQTILATVNPGMTGWLLILGGSFTPLIVGQIGKVISKSMKTKES